MTEMEIAAVMGTWPGTVKSQSARALRRLAGILAVAHPAGHGNTGART
jgi:DNA-directed RNA polymerase specialized sigma24 family protein